MADIEIRRRGIGGSEIAAIVGLDPMRDRFSIYADKLGLIERKQPNERMSWGKLLERAIVQGYSDRTKWATEWCDLSHQNPQRLWQISTPDAYVWQSDKVSGPYEGGVDAKNVAHDQVWRWGPEGGDEVPVTIACQLQWYCSAENVAWWDAAPLFGGHNLRVYRVHRNRDIEATLLEEGDRFWREHVLASNPPPIGFSQAAADYLKQRFPKDIEPLRVASDEEHEIIQRLKEAEKAWDEINNECTSLENNLKLKIGAADGILDGKDKVTYRRSKDTLGTDWEASTTSLIHQIMDLENVPKESRGERFAAMRRALVGKFGIVVRSGSRKLTKTWRDK